MFLVGAGPGSGVRQNAGIKTVPDAQEKQRRQSNADAKSIECSLGGTAHILEQKHQAAAETYEHRNEQYDDDNL